MENYQTLILGIVQGLGEFLPISSSAHLYLVPWFLNWGDQGLTYDVALHLGTLFAVVTYYWKVLWEMARGAMGLSGAVTTSRSLFWKIVVATIPAVIVGKLLKHHAETVFRNPLLMATTLATMGILLWAVDSYFSKKTKTLGELSFRDAILIGIAQCFALVPGFSRSGTTITAALGLGYRREEAARFSFLMSVPIIAGAVLLQSPDIIANKLYSEPGFWIGIGSAGIVGFLAIHLLVRFVSKNSFLPFAVYRVLVAGLVVYIYYSRS